MAPKILNYIKKILPGRSEGVFVSSSEFCVNWSRFHLLNIVFAKVTAILLNTKPNDLSFRLGSGGCATGYRYHSRYRT